MGWINSKTFFGLICAVFYFTAQSGYAAAKESPDCQTIDECLAILISHELPPEPKTGERRSSGISAYKIENAVTGLASFGDAAVGPLVALLRHPKYHVRKRASYVLREFPEIDPRYSSDLIAGHKSGLGWLPIVIARTQTDEALHYLQNAFVENAVYGSNGEFLDALKEFGNRNSAFVLSKLPECIGSDDYKFCHGLFMILRFLELNPDGATELALQVVQSSETSYSVRYSAELFLQGMGHPYFLESLIRQMSAALELISTGNHKSRTEYSRVDHNPPTDFDVSFMIMDVAQLGRAGRRSGPIVEKFLSLKSYPDSRAEAALTLGLIGYKPAVKSLLREKETFSEDWRFAYNATESLGRLKARRAKKTLEDVAAHYWFKPVRNNAERALNYMAGGEFKLPMVPSDPPQNYALSGVKFERDLYAGEVLCDGPRGEAVYNQFNPPQLAWPETLITELELVLPSSSQENAFYAEYPSLRENPLLGTVSGSLEFVVEFGDALIVGTNVGEFGGSVFQIQHDGSVDVLMSDNAQSVFHLGDKLLISTGLAHLGSDEGNVWRIERLAGEIQITQTLRLPGRPNGFLLTPSKAIIVETSNGHAVIGVDGAPLKRDALKMCPQEPPAYISQRTPR